jgi:hypothetical protein
MAAVGGPSVGELLVAAHNGRCPLADADMAVAPDAGQASQQPENVEPSAGWYVDLDFRISWF